MMMRLSGRIFRVVLSTVLANLLVSVFFTLPLVAGEQDREEHHSHAKIVADISRNGAFISRAITSPICKRMGWPTNSRT